MNQDNEISKYSIWCLLSETESINSFSLIDIHLNGTIKIPF